MPTKLGPEEYVKQSTNPAGGSNDMTLYNYNTVSATVSVLMNPNVQYLQPYFGHFVTENGFDQFTVAPTTDTFIVYQGVRNSSFATVNSNDTWNVGGPS